VSLLCIWTLLVQTTALAWPMPPAQHETATMQADAMPCHAAAGHQARHSHHHDCCGDRCACEALCTASASAIPAVVHAIDFFVAAHFEILTDLRAAPPPTPPDRFRPPISVLS